MHVPEMIFKCGNAVLVNALKAIFKVKWAQIDGPVFFVFAKFVIRYINMFVTEILNALVK